MVREYHASISSNVYSKPAQYLCQTFEIHHGQGYLKRCALCLGNYC